MKLLKYYIYGLSLFSFKIQHSLENKIPIQGKKLLVFGEEWCTYMKGIDDLCNIYRIHYHFRKDPIPLHPSPTVDFICLLWSNAKHSYVCQCNMHVVMTWKIMAHATVICPIVCRQGWLFASDNQFQTISPTMELELRTVFFLDAPKMYYGWMPACVLSYPREEVVIN